MSKPKSPQTPPTHAKTLGELKAAGYVSRSVRDELRENMRAALVQNKKLFPGVIGYDKTVIPQLINAVLSRHNFILLGLRGQAKTRILRGLIDLLDEAIPVIADSDIRDDPMNPIGVDSKRLLAEAGDDLPIAWIGRDERYIEKLATPDVTIADLIGDIDPIKAANQRLDFADPEVIHYGIIPRANRGLFAINELPDLAPRIQVGLLNLLEEGDIQIRGFPVRLPLDMMMVFSANPEDYTNRGNIITPLKDRIESQIQTHYPQDLENAMAITRQEAWVERDGVACRLPEYFREIVEEIGFEARRSEFVDQGSGVSARVTISAIENLMSNAERRALLTGAAECVPRICDLGNVLPSITGKIELVYEGEQEGTVAVARHIVGRAVKAVFARIFPEAKQLEADQDRDESAFREVIEWFTKGRGVEISDEATDADYLAALREVKGLEALAQEHMRPVDELELGPAMELVLEGLHQHSMIGREELEGGGTLYGDLLGNMMSQLEGQG